MGPNLSAPISIDAQITRELAIQNKMEAGVHKLLLLGSGEAGKSTVMKQMIKTKGSGFNDAYRQKFCKVICVNILQSTVNLLKGCKDFNIVFRDENLIAAADTIKFALQLDEGNKSKGSMTGNKNFLTKLKNRSLATLNWRKPSLVQIEELNEDLARAIVTLWDSDSVKQVFERCTQKGEYDIPETYKHFVEKLRNYPTWGGPEWIPSDMDVLLVRQRTTGMADITFTVGKFRFRLIDVGGQRSERKKWIFLFEGVTAVIFVAALSEYNQTLWENAEVNRLQESLQLFKHHAESPHFAKSAFILFLNKRDLFEEKYLRQKIPLNVSGLFPDAPKIEDEDGPNSCTKALTWFKLKMLSQLDGKRREIVYVHYTNALDSKAMEAAIAACGEHIWEASLKTSGIV